MVKGKKNYVWVGETHFDIYSPDMSSVLEECVSIYELCNPVEREDLFELGDDEPDFIEFLDKTLPVECIASYYIEDKGVYNLYNLGNDDLTIIEKDGRILDAITSIRYKDLKKVYQATASLVLL